MDIKHYLTTDENEIPLQNIITDGGFCGIFRTIGVIGDSLSSGEFETRDKDGKPGFWDLYEHSWGQHIARNIGATVYNFSKGGMTAHWYWESFANERGFWNQDKICQAYIIALGANDLIMEKKPVGTLNDFLGEGEDIDRDSFGYFMGLIIRRIKSLQPDAKIFLMTMPRHGDIHDEKRDMQSEFLRNAVEHIENTYLLDFNKYAPVYDAEFQRRYFLLGHMNPMGYVLTARMVESYIDYIIRHNPEEFSKVGFIGTPYLEY